MCRTAEYNQLHQTARRLLPQPQAHLVGRLRRSHDSEEVPQLLRLANIRAELRWYLERPPAEQVCLQVFLAQIFPVSCQA